MTFRKKCSGCGKRKFFVKRRSFYCPPIKAILSSELEYCRACFISVINIKYEQPQEGQGDNK